MAQNVRHLSGAVWGCQALRLVGGQAGVLPVTHCGSWSGRPALVRHAETLDHGSRVSEVVVVGEPRTRTNKVDVGHGALNATDAAGSARPVFVWMVTLAVVVLLALAVGTWIVVDQRRSADELASSGSTDVATTTSSPTAPASPAPRATTGPETDEKTPPRTAAPALGGFIARAALADQALREASSRINASITTTDVTYDLRTSELLASAEPEAVASTLPAGMPDALQQHALLVYSDLVSRWAAMSGSCDQGVGTFPRAEFDGCFTQGAPAAARFADDLAALEQLAETTPEFTAASQDSRPAEELAVRIRYIDLGNLGCASKGGYVATDPIPIVWQDIPEDTGGPGWQGTVGPGLAGIPFRGTFDPVLGWRIELLAC